WLTSLHVCVLFCYFFFQAEDGIRDATVTGVQTCALPISHASANAQRAVWPPEEERVMVPPPQVARIASLGYNELAADAVWAETRSEERRVGKEWRRRERPGHKRNRNTIR